MIAREHPLPLTQQCRILNLSRSGIYYVPVPVSEKDTELMRLIDEIHTDSPYLGTRGIRNALWDKGYTVGRSHVRSLMRKMDIEALYQKPRLSKPHPDHKIYPYPLREIAITEANQVWCADITYIPTARGFCYLVAVMDWASRKVLLLSFVGPIGFRPFEYFINCLTFIEAFGDLNIVSAVTMKQRQEPQGCGRTESLVQGFYPFEPYLCIIKHLCFHSPLPSLCNRPDS
jgi:hypothetical protein